jgi:hypothetical protein
MRWAGHVCISWTITHIEVRRVNSSLCVLILRKVIIISTRCILCIYNSLKSAYYSDNIHESFCVTQDNK